MADASELFFIPLFVNRDNQMVENQMNGREPGKAANPCPPSRADDLSTEINLGSECVHALNQDSPLAVAAERDCKGVVAEMWVARSAAAMARNWSFRLKPRIMRAPLEPLCDYMKRVSFSSQLNEVS